MTPQEIGILNRMKTAAQNYKAKYKAAGSPFLFTKWQKAERSLKVKMAEMKMKYEYSPQLNINNL